LRRHRRRATVHRKQRVDAVGQQSGQYADRTADLEGTTKAPALQGSERGAVFAVLVLARFEAPRVALARVQAIEVLGVERRPQPGIRHPGVIPDAVGS
jgi:hypothetical protein